MNMTNNKANTEMRMLRIAGKIGPIVRIMLTPIFLLIRIYHWVWDYDYV